jgi:hypothetical protein
MSLGLQALVADIYWIRTVQYFGRKLSEDGRPLSANTSDLHMPLLAPLLEIITTLDPHHRPAYKFGAIFLPERDMPAAIALLEKGVRENPLEWRVYQDLGYIYWQAGNVAPAEEKREYYARAAEWYDRGSEIPGAMWWMSDLAGLMKIKGGSREVAYAIYSANLDSEDEIVRTQAAGRLKQIQSLSELDIINAVLARIRAQKGNCPDDLKTISGPLATLGLTINNDREPVDPDGFPYEYSKEKCQARLVFRSTVMR